MDRRRLYTLLNPDSADQAARLFRVVHHVLVALGIGAMLADTVPFVAVDYDTVLRAGYYLVGAFFVAEYVLRLIVAPEIPGYEHCSALRARLLWAVSLGGILDFLCALPALAALAWVPSANLLGFIWAFKYVRYSPGLASLGRVVRKAQQALLSVLLGFAIVLLSAASIAYLLERHANPDAFGSIPAALWWAIVTMTTTGYGDVVPQTAAGRILGGEDELLRAPAAPVEIGNQVGRQGAVLSQYRCLADRRGRTLAAAARFSRGRGDHAAGTGRRLHVFHHRWRG